MVLTQGFLPISAAASIYKFQPSSAIGSVPSLPVHAIAYRWRSRPGVRKHRASSPQGSSSNGCCTCITMDQLICASLFPHPLYYYWYEINGHVESIGDLRCMFSFRTVFFYLVTTEWILVSAYEEIQLINQDIRHTRHFRMFRGLGQSETQMWGWLVAYRELPTMSRFRSGTPDFVVLPNIHKIGYIIWLYQEARV